MLADEDMSAWPQRHRPQQHFVPEGVDVALVAGVSRMALAVLAVDARVERVGPPADDTAAEETETADERRVTQLHDRASLPFPRRLRLRTSCQATSSCLRRRGEGRAAGRLSLFFCLAPLQGRLHEAPEQRMRLRRLRLELRMTLQRQEPRTIAQLDHLHRLAVRAGPREEHAVGRELLAIGVVELVTMPMPLMHLQVAVGLMGLAPFKDGAGIRSQPHRAAEFGHLELLVE